MSNIITYFLCGFKPLILIRIAEIFLRRTNTFDVLRVRFLYSRIIGASSWKNYLETCGDQLLWWSFLFQFHKRFATIGALVTPHGYHFGPMGLEYLQAVGDYSYLDVLLGLNSFLPIPEIMTSPLRYCCVILIFTWCFSCGFSCWDSTSRDSRWCEISFKCWSGHITFT